MKEDPRVILRFKQAIYDPRHELLYLAHHPSFGEKGVSFSHELSKIHPVLKQELYGLFTTYTKTLHGRRSTRLLP